MLPTSFENKNDRLKAVDRSKHDDGDKGELATSGRDKVNEVSEVDDCCR